MLSKRNEFARVAYYTIPNICHSEERETRDDKKIRDCWRREVKRTE